jgi:hypothetical protein
MKTIIVTPFTLLWVLFMVIIALVTRKVEGGKLLIPKYKGKFLFGKITFEEVWQKDYSVILLDASNRYITYIFFIATNIVSFQPFTSYITKRANELTLLNDNLETRFSKFSNRLLIVEAALTPSKPSETTSIADIAINKGKTNVNVDEEAPSVKEFNQKVKEAVSNELPNGELLTTAEIKDPNATQVKSPISKTKRSIKKI